MNKEEIIDDTEQYILDLSKNIFLKILDAKKLEKLAATGPQKGAAPLAEYIGVTTSLSRLTAIGFYSNAVPGLKRSVEIMKKCVVEKEKNANN